MKLRMFVIMAALVASASLSRANITGETLADDGDGVITCKIYSLITNSPGNYQLNIHGDHNIWGPGHILGNIYTDTETDPTLALDQSIDNDTGSAWGDYQVQVTMNKSFTFSNIGVANSGWTFTVTQPTQVGSDWIGDVDYYAGIPVSISGTLDFNYSITFTGSASFAEQLTPSPVPEPMSAGVLLLGLGVLVCSQRSRRSGIW
jgi:hypothetical protein